MKILMLLDNAFKGDPRVSREIDALLESGFSIDLFCLANQELPEIEEKSNLTIHRSIISSIFDVKDRNYLSFISKKITATINPEEVNFIHCHDHHMLNLGSILKPSIPNTKLIYDAHELFFSYPIMNDSKWKNYWLYLKSKVVRYIHLKREQKNIKKADAVITVNDSIAQLLQNKYNLKDKPEVVRNIPSRTNPILNKEYFRLKFDIPKEDAVVIFITGRLQPKGHNLDQVIAEMGKLPHVSLVITGDGPGREALVKKCERLNYNNIYFHEAVAPNDIINHLAQADFGLLPFWNKKDLSFWYALPNKLFEYIMAELPILSTSQPEYKKIISQYNVGVSVNPEIPGAFKTGIQQLVAQKTEFIKNIKIAKNELNWEKEKGKLLDLYSALQQ